MGPYTIRYKLRYKVRYKLPKKEEAVMFKNYSTICEVIKIISHDRWTKNLFVAANNHMNNLINKSHN